MPDISSLLCCFRRNAIDPQPTRNRYETSAHALSWRVGMAATVVLGSLAVGLYLYFRDRAAQQPIMDVRESSLDEYRVSVPYHVQPLRKKYGPFFSPELNCTIKEAANSWWVTAEERYANAVQQDIPEQMLPYLKFVDHMAPVRDRNEGQFPENLHAFLHPSFGLVRKGDCGCRIKKNLTDYLQCEEATKIALANIRKEQLGDQIFTPRAFRHKGYLLAFPTHTNYNLTLNVGMNPRKLGNYHTALKIASKEFLQDNCFFRKEPQEILDFIQRLHKAIMQGLPPRDDERAEVAPGKWRTTAMMAFRDENNFKFAESLEKYGATREDIATFTDSIRKLKHNNDNFYTFYNSLNPRELSVWRKLAYQAPDPRDLPGLMEVFAQNLKKYAQRDLHPVALGAWAHAELGRLQPFSLGNGRLARLVMNSILVRGGYEPVIINDGDKYAEALFEDHYNRGAFATYLSNLIQSQSTGIQLLDHVK